MQLSHGVRAAFHVGENSKLFFGAGKTRAAPAMIAGLLVMDPTLKVMVVTKENAAAHAFAKHIESLQLPPSLEEKFGRLVGVTELEKGHLNDEGQLYGNLDESSAIARVPRKGLVVWCGDHKQTPGGLRKSDEASLPTQADAKAHCLEGRHEVHTTPYAGRYSPSVCARCAWTPSCRVRQLLNESTRQPLGLSTGSVAVLQELCQETTGRSRDAGITRELTETFASSPLRNPTLVCASSRRYAVIPAQEVTLREMTAPPATHSVVAKAFTILLRLWSTARSPSWATKNLLLIQSTTSPMSVLALM